MIGDQRAAPTAVPERRGDQGSGDRPRAPACRGDKKKEGDNPFLCFIDNSETALFLRFWQIIAALGSLCRAAGNPFLNPGKTYGTAPLSGTT
jgi:hypothetical protein